MASAALAPASREYVDDDNTYTFYCSSANVAVGDAVSLDATADMTVKWGADGAEIFGRVETVENRLQDGILLVAVCTEFMGRLPLKNGETPVVGSTVVAAGNGQVRVRTAAATLGAANNIFVVSTAENTAGFANVKARG